MRPDNVNIVDVIRAVEGSSDSLDDITQALYGDDFDWMFDLTDEELKYFDSRVFQCAECGWWKTTNELNKKIIDENFCTDCRED